MSANNAIELCAGYGGLHMGLESVTGAQLTHVSEIDPGAVSILKRHHPDVPNLGDLKAIDWDAVPDLPSRVRWLLAGYPCQPFSDAGQRLGTADPRHLWPWVAASVAALNPDFVLFENVRGHVKRGLPEVLDSLVLLGYVVAWAVVRASDVGAPHQRARVFIMGVRSELAGCEPGHREIQAHEAPTALLLPTPMSRDGKGRSNEAREGTPGLNNAVLSLPTPRTSDGRGPGARNAGRATPDTLRDAVKLLPTLSTGGSPNGHGRRDGRLGNGRQSGASLDALGTRADVWAQYAPAIERWERVTGRPAPDPLEPSHDGKGVRLHCRLPEWMMGLPDGHVLDTPGLSRNAALRALGNGVVPLQAAYAVGLLLRALSTADHWELAA